MCERARQKRAVKLRGGADKIPAYKNGRPKRRGSAARTLQYENGRPKRHGSGAKIPVYENERPKRRGRTRSGSPKRATTGSDEKACLSTGERGAVLLKRCRCDRLFSCCAQGQAVRREVSIQCVLQEMPPLPHPLETFAVRSSTSSSSEEGTDRGTGEALKSQRLFECHLCQFSTPKLPLLKLHLEKHSTEGVYKCEVCEALFMRLDTYRAHMCKHTGEKLYQCNLCPHSTSYDGALKRHMRTHFKPDRLPAQCAHIDATPSQTSVDT